MVEIMKAKPAKIFRVLDGEGRPIGQVVAPSSAPILACGGRTVLLVREEHLQSQLPVRACA
jgi:hypothetical protein